MQEVNIVNSRMNLPLRSRHYLRHMIYVGNLTDGKGKAYCVTELDKQPRLFPASFTESLHVNNNVAGNTQWHSVAVFWYRTQIF